MVRLFRSSSSNAEISEGLGVPTSASVRQALKKYNAKAAPRAVRDVLKELGGITKVLEDATLQEMHKVLTTEDSLRDIVKVITEPPTSTVSEMDVPVSSPREEHLEQWVGSVLITHGPTEFRVNLLKSNALVLLLLKFYNENPAYDEVQTSLVTKVVSAVHSENDGTVGNVLSQNPDVVIGMFNRIECSTVSNLVPRLLVDVEPSHKYPFDYENAHRRSAWALYNAGVYEVLSSRFAKTACKSSYELKDVKILENCAYTIGELAGRTACLERVSEAELASMVAQSSARLYGSARIGLDMYRNPTTLVNLLACGLKEYTKRRRAQRANNASGSNAVGPTEDIALQCALKALLLMLRRHEQGLRCSERIAKALRGTNTAAMEEKLKRFIPDFMSIIKSGIQQRSLVQFQITEVLSYCLVLFKEMSFYLFEQGVLDVLVATASAHNGVAYLQLEIGAFTAALRGKDLKLQIAWLRNKTFIDFIMNEATRDSADRSRQANARLALWELKTFLEARQGGDANPRASHSNGLENLLQRINSIPLDKVQDDLFGYLVRFRGHAEKSQNTSNFLCVFIIRSPMDVPTLGTNSRITRK